MKSEQRNYWISAFKYMIKHMNQFRFNFFLYIVFDEITLKGRIKIFDKMSYQSDPIKRKFSTVIGYDDESDNVSEQATSKKTCYT